MNNGPAVDVNSVLDSEINGSTIVTNSFRGDAVSVASVKQTSFISSLTGNSNNINNFDRNPNADTKESIGSRWNNKDDALSDIIVENGEASFPSVEELGISSRDLNSHKLNHTIWPGASAKNGLSHDGVTTSSTKNTKRRYLWIVLLVIVLLVLIVIVPAVVVRNNKQEVKNSSDASELDDPTSRPRPTYDEIADFIVSNYISYERDVDDMLSPQSQAITWLAEDDPANIIVPSSFDTYQGYKYMVRYVMALTYFALNGPTWSQKLNFLSEADVCDWNEDVRSGSGVHQNGLFCNTNLASDGASLEQNPSALHLVIQMDGEVPRELGKLSSVSTLQLTGNERLVGTIPSDLCTLTNLEGLFLNYNSLSNEIPTCLGEIKLLQYLHLESNMLYGTIPSELCGLDDLKQLYVSYNTLSGTLPPCLGYRQNLEEIELFGNNFNGSIPVDLCQAQRLKRINLGRNFHSGEIPECFGEYEALERLDLSENLLVGNVPDSFVGLNETLRYLNVDSNDLTDDPSNTFNQLNAIETLIGSNNKFNFIMGSSFMNNADNLVHLDLSNNDLSGEFPLHLLSYSKINTIDISDNGLSGQFSNVDNNSSLQHLGVYQNNMNGNLSELAKLTKLIHLDVSDNQFTGSLEPIGTLIYLKNAFLSGNPFESGPIPQSFLDLNKLEELSLRNTSLTGPLPEINETVWDDLKLLDLGSNNLNGGVPTSYGTLRNLLYLLLNDNNGITGMLPTEFKNMTQLKGVLLDGTSIIEPLEILCQLPNFENNITGNEIVVVDCTDGNDACDTCVGCQCCNENNNEGCSNPNLGNIDIAWTWSWRRPMNAYNFTRGNSFNDT